MPCSPFFKRRAESLSPLGICAANRALISCQRVEKSASPEGKVQIQCRWSGKITMASMVNGRRRRAALNTSRRWSMFSVKSFRRRSSSVTVKKKVPPGTKARIYCGISQAKPNCRRRDAFHFPALRLLAQHSRVERLNSGSSSRKRTPCSAIYPSGSGGGAPADEHGGVRLNKLVGQWFQ